jgi:hypothetical protein
MPKKSKRTIIASTRKRKQKQHSRRKLDTRIAKRQTQARRDRNFFVPRKRPRIVRRKVARLSHAANVNFLHSLFRTRLSKQRCILIQKASKEQILTLVEFIFNILLRHIPLTSRQKKLLCKFKRALHLIVNRGISCEQKRKIIIRSEQKGGFLGVLASIGIPLIASLISSLTGN